MDEKEHVRLDMLKITLNGARVIIPRLWILIAL